MEGPLQQVRLQSIEAVSAAPGAGEGVLARSATAKGGSSAWRPSEAHSLSGRTAPAGSWGLSSPAGIVTISVGRATAKDSVTDSAETATLRNVDPLLTILGSRQLVATDGNLSA